MNTCKNCKYFKRNKDNYRSEKYGECSCDKFAYDSWISEKEETDKLFYWDYEDYSANFNVGENFGCIHFEEKELQDEN